MSNELEQINREQSHSEVDPFSEGRYRFAIACNVRDAQLNPAPPHDAP